MTEYTTICFQDDFLCIMPCIINTGLVNFIFRRVSLNDLSETDPFGVYIEGKPPLQEIDVKAKFKKPKIDMSQCLFGK